MSVCAQAAARLSSTWGLKAGACDAMHAQVSTRTCECNLYSWYASVTHMRSRVLHKDYIVKVYVALYANQTSHT